MRLWQAFIVFLLCALAQAAFAHLVPAFRTARVDLCLIVLIGTALRVDEQRGFFLGVLAGLATDLLGGGPLGVCALGYGAVGFVVGGLHEALFHGAIVLRLFLVLAAAMICAVVVHYVLRLHGEAYSLLVMFPHALLPSALATAVIGLFVLGRMERHPRMYRHHD
jgi:rod shape-determining protein MreD